MIDGYQTHQVVLSIFIINRGVIYIISLTNGLVLCFFLFFISRASVLTIDGALVAYLFVLVEYILLRLQTILRLHHILTNSLFTSLIFIFWILFCMVIDFFDDLQIQDWPIFPFCFSIDVKIHPFIVLHIFF